MKNIEPYVLDDRVIISDEIQKMTKEERRAEIERLEKESVERKQKNNKLSKAV